MAKFKVILSQDYKGTALNEAFLKKGEIIEGTIMESEDPRGGSRPKIKGFSYSKDVNGNKMYAFLPYYNLEEIKEVIADVKSTDATVKPSFVEAFKELPTEKKVGYIGFTVLVLSVAVIGGVIMFKNAKKG